MKLIYLYVENCMKELEKKELNFSSRYIIERVSNFEIFKESGILNFEVRKKEFYDDILYGKNIEVYGIVGNNGAGKSTVLDYIRRLHYDYEAFEKECQWACSIWEDNGEFYLYQCGNNEKFSVHLYDFVSKERILFKSKENINKRTGMIYYSDIVDEKYIYNKFNTGHVNFRNFRRQENVSTSYYMYTALSKDKSMRSYFHKEVERELGFIGDVAKMYENLKVLYHIPNMIEMILVLTDFSVIENKLKDKLDHYSRDIHHVSNASLQETIFISILKLLKAEYRVLQKRIAGIKKWDRYYHGDYLWLQCILEYNVILDIINTFMEDSYVEPKEEIDEILKNIENYIYGMFANCPRENPFQDDFDKMHMFNKCLLDTLLNSSKVRYEKEDLQWLEASFKACVWRTDLEISIKNNNQCSFYIETGKSEFMDTVLDLYIEYQKIAGDNWLKFTWGMSSGEKSRVTLFSRFYDVLKNTYGDDFLILMDELDYYMHPSWQQNILAEFVQFLDTMFPEQRFQIIFTTHSPITLSDIRKDNILFLSNEEGDKDETFAANIASLYWSAFSMKNGSVGAVGSKFFEKLISALNIVRTEYKSQSMRGKQEVFLMTYYEKDREEIRAMNKEQEVRRIRNLVESIGEDIYRIKLLEIFDGCKLLPKENNLELRMEQLIKEYGRERIAKYFKG